MAMSRSFGGNVVTTRPPIPIFTAGDSLKARRSCAAAWIFRSPKGQRESQLAVANVDRHAVNDFDRSERFTDFADGNRRHASAPRWTSQCDCIHYYLLANLLPRAPLRRKAAPSRAIQSRHRCSGLFGRRIFVHVAAIVRTRHDASVQAMQHRRYPGPTGTLPKAAGEYRARNPAGTDPSRGPRTSDQRLTFLDCRAQMRRCRAPDRRDCR